MESNLYECKLEYQERVGLKDILGLKLSFDRSSLSLELPKRVGAIYLNVHHKDGYIQQISRKTESLNVETAEKVELFLVTKVHNQRIKSHLVDVVFEPGWNLFVNPQWNANINVNQKHTLTANDRKTVNINTEDSEKVTIAAPIGMKLYTCNDHKEIKYDFLKDTLDFNKQVNCVNLYNGTSLIAKVKKNRFDKGTHVIKGSSEMQFFGMEVQNVYNDHRISQSSHQLKIYNEEGSVISTLKVIDHTVNYGDMQGAMLCYNEADEIGWVCQDYPTGGVPLSNPAILRIVLIDEIERENFQGFEEIYIAGKLDKNNNTLKYVEVEVV